jgi:hypothetical protein
MYEPFEEDPAQPVIERFSLTRIFKNGYSPMRDEFAFVMINVGECQIGASLLFDGSLKLPAGVRVPLDLQQRVKREAQRMAIHELAAEWDRQRDVGADGRWIVGDA